MEIETGMDHTGNHREVWIFLHQVLSQFRGTGRKHRDSHMSVLLLMKTRLEDAIPDLSSRGLTNNPSNQNGTYSP